MSGHFRQGSDTDLHPFGNSPAFITDVLERAECQFDFGCKQVVEYGEARIKQIIAAMLRFCSALRLSDLCISPLSVGTNFI